MTTSALSDPAAPGAARLHDHPWAPHGDEAAPAAPWSWLPWQDTGLSSMYRRFGTLFAPAFGLDDPAVVAAVDTVGHEMAGAMMTCDRMVDEGPVTAVTVAQLAALQSSAYAGVARLVGGDPVFWTPFLERLERYLFSLLADREFVDGRRAVTSLSVQEAVDLAEGRGCVAAGTPALLAALAGRPAPFAPLARSIDSFSVAQQMLDDVVDWRADLLAGRPSLVLASAARAVGSDHPDANAVGHAIYFGGCLAEVHEVAVDHADRAIAAAAEVDCPPWSATLRAARTKIDEMLAVTVGVPRRHRVRPALEVRLPAATGVADTAANGAVRVALRAIAQGARDLRHVMQFPAGMGFRSPGTYVGDVFSRALVADCLLDVRPRVGTSLDPLFAADLAHLQDRHAASGRWCYFPGFDDLPDDLDTLAEVARFACRAGAPDDVQDALRAEVAAAADGIGVDGALSTWRYATDDDTAAAQRRAVDRFWGRECDPEVVANIAYTASVLDVPAWRPRLADVAAWVARHQEEDGAWAATWYAGPFYATAVATRLLARIGGFDTALDRAVAGVAARQLPDGSWGLPGTATIGTGDVLSTSLALLAVRHGTPAGAAPEPRVEQALAWLGSAVAQDHTEAPAFVVMDLNRTADAPAELLEYRSATIAAAFAVRAATAWTR